MDPNISVALGELLTVLGEGKSSTSLSLYCQTFILSLLTQRWQPCCGLLISQAPLLPTTTPLVQWYIFLYFWFIVLLLSYSYKLKYFRVSKLWDLELKKNSAQEWWLCVVYTSLGKSKLRFTKITFHQPVLSFANLI